ncbi:hypothetical protein D3C81_608960 [compost metagenome]
MAVKERPVAPGQPMQKAQVLGLRCEHAAPPRTAEPPGQGRAEQPEGENGGGQQQDTRAHRQRARQHKHQGWLRPLFAVDRLQRIGTVAFILP